MNKKVAGLVFTGTIICSSLGIVQPSYASSDTATAIERSNNNSVENDQSWVRWEMEIRKDKLHIGSIVNGIIGNLPKENFVQNLSERIHNLVHYKSYTVKVVPLAEASNYEQYAANMKFDASLMYYGQQYKIYVF